MCRTGTTDLYETQKRQGAKNSGAKETCSSAKTESSWRNVGCGLRSQQETGNDISSYATALPGRNGEQEGRSRAGRGGEGRGGCTLAPSTLLFSQ